MNPLTAISADFRKKLLQERDEARRDSRLKARFLSYRLNVPSADESTVLLTVDDWKRVCARPVPERTGRPIVGIDLGNGRAWSAAVALWRSGRVECIAQAPGVPNLDEQERRDRVSAGTYRKLAENGSLRVAASVRVQPVGGLIKAAREKWGAPEVLFADRARINELRDVINGTPLVERATRYFGGDEDVRATRKLALDGPLAVAPDSRNLLAASLAVAVVKNKDGLTWLEKKDPHNNTGRDDVAAALVLACGALSRAPVPRRRLRSAIVG